MHPKDFHKAVDEAESAFGDQGEMTNLSIDEAHWHATIALEEGSYTTELYYYEDGEAILRYTKPFDSATYSVRNLKLDEVRDRWPELLAYAQKFPHCFGEEPTVYQLGINPPPA